MGDSWDRRRFLAALGAWGSMPLLLPPGNPDVRRMLGGRRRSASRPPLVPIGISTGQYLAGLDATTRGQVLDLAVGLGARWIRETIVWGDIQPTNSSTFNWTIWDSIASQCAARGLKIIANIGGSPAWARPTTYAAGNPSAPPDNPATFGTFCTAAATRFSATIRHWEIWNEPNIKTFWGGAAAPFDCNPVVYYGVLAAAYDAIHGVDAGATVITAGLAPAPTSGGNYAPLDFLDGVLDTGTTKQDGIGVHPYNFPLLPSSTFYDHPWRQLYLTTPSMRTILTDHGVGGLKFWVTEFGAPTNGPGVAATRANGYGTSTYPPLLLYNDEQTQGDICDEAVRAVRARPDQFAHFDWYTILDFEPPGTMTDREYHFGILENPTGNPKDAAPIFTAAIMATGGPA